MLTDFPFSDTPRTSYLLISTAPLPIFAARRAQVVPRSCTTPTLRLGLHLLIAAEVFLALSSWPSTMSDETTNALGLDFSELTVNEPEPPRSEEPPETPSAVPEGTEATSSAVKKEKGRPYVNPERVKTGGAQRV